MTKLILIKNDRLVSLWKRVDNNGNILGYRVTADWTSSGYKTIAEAEEAFDYYCSVKNK